MFATAISLLVLSQDATPVGREAFVKLCATCHRPEVASSGRRSRTQWEEVVEKMIAKGAKGSDEEFGAVIDYLVANHGRVNVNGASASEIAEVLGLTLEEADAIVKHRRANGKIEDFEALAKVPQVDVKKLEQRRASIAY